MTERRKHPGMTDAEIESIRKAREQLAKRKIVGKGPELYYDPEDDTCKPIEAVARDPLCSCLGPIHEKEGDLCSRQVNKAVALKLGHSEDELEAWENSPEFDYCHSIAAAWEVCEYLHKNHGSIYLEGIPDGWSFQIGGVGIIESAHTAPMAICLAFLKLPS